MTLNANRLFTVTPEPEYKYCKIRKAASKLWLGVLMVHEIHVNGPVAWHVRDVEQGAARYGFSLICLHAKTYPKGGLMVLLRDDVQIDSHGPLPLTSQPDERVLQVGPQLLSGDRLTLQNAHAPNPAADRKVFWEELVGVQQLTICLVAGDMKSLTDVQDVNYMPIWSQNEKTATRVEQA